MNTTKPRHLLLSIASGSAAVLSIQALACNQHTMGDIPSGGFYCQPLDGSLPDGAARDTCNVYDAPTDSGADAEASDARPAAFVDAGMAVTPTDGGDAR